MSNPVLGRREQRVIQLFKVVDEKIHILENCEKNLNQDLSFLEDAGQAMERRYEGLVVELLIDLYLISDEDTDFIQ